MRKLKSIFCIALAALLLFSVPDLTADAQSIAQMQQEQRRIREQIEAARNDLNSTILQRLEVELEITELDIKLEEATQRLETIEWQLENTEAALVNAEQELEKAQIERDEQFEQFTTRLRVMREIGTVGYLEVILKAESISDFIKRIDYMNAMAKSDREMADKLQAAEERCTQIVADIEEIKSSIEVQLDLERVYKDELEELYAQKSVWHTELRAQESTYEAIIAAEQEADIELGERIKKAQEEEAARQRELAAQRARELEARMAEMGVFQWPLPGYTTITSPFGGRVHPISGKWEGHSGLDIGAPSGSKVVAAETGIVIISGYSSGYGNYIVIDHGGGVTTLYGHHSRNLVSVGAQVTRGQEIARVGSTGISTGPHLHFEVRINGTAKDPKPYLGY